MDRDKRPSPWMMSDDELATEVSVLRERSDNAHDKLDMLGVPRGRTPEQKLTILGRLDWLEEHIPNLADQIEAAKAKNDGH